MWGSYAPVAPRVGRFPISSLAMMEVIGNTEEQTVIKSFYMN